MINIPLNCNRNRKLLIMTKSNKTLIGSAEKNEVKGTNLCSCGSQYQKYPKRDPYSKTVFQCPVKCEGDKTFIIRGNCPVCNAVLVLVAEVQQLYYLY